MNSFRVLECPGNVTPTSRQQNGAGVKAPGSSCSSRPPPLSPPPNWFLRWELLGWWSGGAEFWCHPDVALQNCIEGLQLRRHVQPFSSNLAFDRTRSEQATSLIAHLIDACLLLLSSFVLTTCKEQGDEHSTKQSIIQWDERGLVCTCSWFGVGGLVCNTWFGLVGWFAVGVQLPSPIIC